jgi:putative endonuclease
MFYVYVLRSRVTAKHYTGSTRDLAVRLAWHNEGLNRSTKHARPWEMIYFEQFETRSEAMRRERFLKSGQGREELSEF